MTNAGDMDFSAPFSATRTFNQYVKWEANDPLVHYTIPDMTDLLVLPEKIQWDGNNNASPLLKMYTQNPINDHYRPWPFSVDDQAETAPPTRMVSGVKDPLQYNSDSWDFPTNRLATVSLLGRVHRGSPWQTVYLKSKEMDTNSWVRWSGNTIGTNNFDAYNARPASDRLLFDVFTAAARFS
jgi:hypothetical protein